MEVARQQERFGTVRANGGAPSPITAHHRTRDSFRGITTAIPVGAFDDLTAPGNIAFSKRGTLLLNGERVNAALEQHAQPKQQLIQTQEDTSRLRQPKPVPRGRVISVDEALISQRVRSMYEYGAESTSDWEAQSEIATMPSLSQSAPASRGSNSNRTLDKARGTTIPLSRKSSNITANRGSIIVKDSYETAGGIEDWEDVESGDVDRYGFIVPRKDPAPDSTSTVQPSAEPSQDKQTLQRVSTSLQLLSSQPRRERTLRRARSSAGRPDASGGLKRKPSRKSLRSQASRQSARSFTTVRTQSRIRYATNRLPHNKDRRCLEEASDMLTLPPGLSPIPEDHYDARSELFSKRREWTREDKWRKMAKVITASGKGGGMIFDFDMKDPKLISRVWKGIPDSWRATAWFSFLNTEAKKHGMVDNDELIENFYTLQDEDCADDWQIDVDVPRTIGRHIMFRRRYRGG